MLRFPTSFDDLMNMISNNMNIIISFLVGVFAAPTVSQIIDRIRGD